MCVFLTTAHIGHLEFPAVMYLLIHSEQTAHTHTHTHTYTYTNTHTTVTYGAPPVAYICMYYTYSCESTGVASWQSGRTQSISDSAATGPAPVKG